MGFTPRSSEELRSREDWAAQFIEEDGKQFKSDLRALTEKPRVAGTDFDRQMAEYVRKQFEACGLEVTEEPFDIYLPFPEEVSIEMVEPQQISFQLGEEGYEEDPESFHGRDLPPYNAFSPSGEVTAEVVYANEGTPADLDRLRELGVPFEGNIALVRYGHGYRGRKAAACEAAGFAGVLFYSDPADSGFKKGEVYPDGPWMNASGIERGCILNSIGDPLTPGWGSIPGGNRLDPEKVKLPEIPTAPISYGAAERILENLAGAIVPEEWQGGFSKEYHTGPGPAKIAMRLKMEYGTRRIVDVLGRLEGWGEPEHLVILGAHRDSWGPGAADNGGGTAALLEAARALKELKEAGFKPRRTIVLASWDAEEVGLTGSTEWLESRSATVRAGVVAYLNADMIGAGKEIYAAASPELKELVREALADTPGRRGRSSLLDDLAGRLERTEKGSEEGGRVRIPDAWAGSDHVSFMQFGIPVTTHGFYSPSGLYHTAYDTYWTCNRFLDPGFKNHLRATVVWVKMALRLADAECIPYDPGEYGRRILEKITGLEKLVKGSAAPPPLEGLDLAGLRAAARRFNDEGRLFVEAAEKAAAAGRMPPNPVLNEVSGKLLEAERGFSRSEDLGDRLLFRHLLYSPGRAGREGRPDLIPAISGAVTAGDWEEAGAEVGFLTTGLQTAADRLAEARELLVSGENR